LLPEHVVDLLKQIYNNLVRIRWDDVYKNGDGYWGVAFNFRKIYHLCPNTDINMYFNHGMNDVLPKPFTKEGLLNMLEKYLSHLKANEGQIPTQLNFNEHDNRIIVEQGNIMAKSGLKYSQSPSKSPQNAVLYGRPPSDAVEDPIGETPSVVEDTAYANLIPGYLGDSTAPRTTGTFPSPGALAHGIRRGASEMDGSQQQLMGLDAKKTRY
jgi:osomolarity two-component system response regulator SKN7